MTDRKRIEQRAAAIVESLQERIQAGKAVTAREAFVCRVAAMVAQIADGEELTISRRDVELLSVVAVEMAVGSAEVQLAAEDGQERGGAELAFTAGLTTTH